MKIEHQVISLALAKRLKALGVKQESAFAWTAMAALPETDWSLWGTGKSVEEWEGDWRIAAFTVAELGEMLPACVDCGDTGVMGERYAALQAHKHGSWDVHYIVYHKGIGYVLNGHEGAKFHHENEAEARGLMLAYLLENNLAQV